MYTWKSYFIVQADYQHWANEALFAALDGLTDEARNGDEGLFFRNMHHTVDHLFQVSQLWRARLQGEYLKPDLGTVRQPDWRELKAALRQEVRRLQGWLQDQPDEWFDEQLSYVDSEGHYRSMWVRDVLVHLFNHFTHHRGQVSAVATRLGTPCPVMDYVYYRQEMENVLCEVARP